MSKRGTPTRAQPSKTRVDFAIAHPGTAALHPPLDQLITQCRELELPVPRPLRLNLGLGMFAKAFQLHDEVTFVEGESTPRVALFRESRGGEFPPTRDSGQHLVPAANSGWEALVAVAGRVPRRAGLKAGNPWVEIMKAAEMAPSGLPRSNAESLHDEKAIARLPAFWLQAERAVIALSRLGTRLPTLRQALGRSLERPLALVAHVTADASISVTGGCEGVLPMFPKSWDDPPVKLQRGSVQFAARGPVVLPLNRRARHHVVAALLWLKAALRQGEALELQEAQERRLVLTDLRGVTAEVTGWTVPPGVDGLNAAVFMSMREDRRGILSEGPDEGFATMPMRYADELTHPRVLWLGSGVHTFRVEFGPPNGLLDWVPDTAAEQALIERDAQVADDDDDDDLDGDRGGGGWPSTTGNPSGGGRWNG